MNTDPASIRKYKDHISQLKALDESNKRIISLQAEQISLMEKVIREKDAELTLLKRQLEELTRLSREMAGLL